LHDITSMHVCIQPCDDGKEINLLGCKGRIITFHKDGMDLNACLVSGKVSSQCSSSRDL
jgi:hypothetical protein